MRVILREHNKICRRVASFCQQRSRRVALTKFFSNAMKRIWHGGWAPSVVFVKWLNPVAENNRLSTLLPGRGSVLALNRDLIAVVQVGAIANDPHLDLFVGQDQQMLAGLIEGTAQVLSKGLQ